jgi:hypothetical protein
MNIYLIVILILFLFSCGSKYPDIRPFDGKIISDKEDNDSLKKAIDVNSNLPIVGFFNSKGKGKGGDRDCYKVSFALAGISYKIILTGVPGIDSKLSFYSANYSLLFSLDDGGKGESEKAWEYFPSSDTIIITVESKTGYNEKVPYVVNFAPNIKGSVNEIEPNNDKETAIQIRLGEEKKGLILPKEDFDFYKIVFEDDKSHDFNIKVKVYSPFDINFTLYNEKNGSAKFINSYSWSGMETYPYLNSKKGEYFIKVGGVINPNEANKNPLYSILIEEIDPDMAEKDNYYEQENNDEPEYATEIISGGTTIGAFYPENDADFFTFDLYKNPLSVDVSLSRIREIDPIIEIYDSSKKLIRTINDEKEDQGEKVILNALQKGRYYIKVFSKNKSLLVYKLFFNIRYN